MKSIVKTKSLVCRSLKLAYRLLNRTTFQKYRLFTE